jgi:hypothetical protein
MLVNRWYAGAWLPISGSAKSTFPRPTSSALRYLAHLLRDPRSPGWLDVLCREAQLLIPALVAGARLWSRWRSVRAGGSDEQDVELAITLGAAGVLSLFAYDFAFVPLFATGPWYTPVSVVFVSLVAVRAAPRVRATTARLGLAALAGALVFGAFHRRPGYHREYAELYLRDAARLRAHYGAERPQLVEYDDGIVAFATGLPSMSGFGFTDDVGAARARRAGRLLELARERGFDRLASLAYAPAIDADRDRAAVRMAEACLGVEDAGFEVEYRSPYTRLVVVSLDPARTAAAP